MKLKPNHIPQVDYIRAFASLAVAIFHLGGKSLPVLRYGWLGVEMFFLLSGFIICWAMPNGYTLKMFGKFVAKRIVRIEPPYIISVGLAIIAHYIWVAGYKPDWVNILLHLGYLNNFFNQEYLSPVFWTLGIEFQFYLFIAFCFPIIVKKWGALFVLALCTLPIFFHGGTTLLAFFPIFGIGILYFQYLKKVITPKHTLLVGILIIIISVYCLSWTLTVAALFALGILLIPLKSIPIVRFFSKISFSLYLTHDIVGSNLVAHMGMIFPKSIVFKSIEFLTGLGVSIVFAYFFYLFVEAPCLALSKRISYKKMTLIKKNQNEIVIADAFIN